MIEVEKLSRNFGTFRAVDEISFFVGRGKIVGFLGPNGAGKTTTLRMLTGYLPPTSGNANVAGCDIFRDSLRARRKIGYMPERVPLYNEMRVKEFLRHRAQIKGLAGREMRHGVSEVMDLCGITQMRKRMIKTLSKGYRQRVGIADALIHNPELIVLDEPTNGLDPNQIRKIRKLIKKMGGEHTILVSTHILPEVEMLCDYVIIIDEGKIKSTGTPQDLIKKMRAAGKIDVEILADPEVVAGALRRIKYVKKVIPEKPQDQWSRFSVLVDSGTDTRERIANLAAQYGWPLRTLMRNIPSLEDVFIELTRKD